REWIVADIFDDADHHALAVPGEHPPERRGSRPELPRNRLVDQDRLSSFTSREAAAAQDRDAERVEITRRHLYAEHVFWRVVTAADRDPHAIGDTERRVVGKRRRGAADG